MIDIEIHLGETAERWTTTILGGGVQGNDKINWASALFDNKLSALEVTSIGGNAIAQDHLEVLAIFLQGEAKGKHRGNRVTIGADVRRKEDALSGSETLTGFVEKLFIHVCSL
jgi:hypothetical protein